GAERDGATTPSFWGSYERVIVVNGLSKAYGLPGLRIGWVVAPPGFSGDAWARHDYTTIGPAGASDHLAAVALEPRVREQVLGRGEAALPDPMVLELREQQAEVHVKGAHLAGGRHIVLKVATGFYRNRARGLPSGDGMFLLLDADTGVPAVLLEEHGYLTDFRTAAAVALTLKYLAPKDTREALLVGAGALARLTARAMLAQMPLARLT